MHTNVSISKEGKNLFWDPDGEEKISPLAWSFIDRTLSSANDICLLLNASVNAYRRLDPHFEAPNQIKASPIDRGSMVRVPLGNEKSSRVEVRSVGPDANPYMALYSIFRTGIEGEISKIKDLRQAKRYLPDNVYTAIDDFRGQMDHQSARRGCQSSLRRSQASLGGPVPTATRHLIKVPEIQFHHDVYNQFLWNQF